MRSFVPSRIFVLGIILLLSVIYLLPLCVSQGAGGLSDDARVANGQILFAPMDSTTTYIIDRTGTVNHTWSSSYFPGESVRWAGDGTLLRTIKVGFSGYGGSGGGIQKVEWNGNVTWDFRYNTGGNLSHHDAVQLPNGDVLMIAWEEKTKEEAIAAGRNPDTIQGNTFMPVHIIEVKPTGPTSGDIVWEWHVWDHLIQDYDSSKANYGVVADHPELVDINYGVIDPFLSDWLHTDSIDYNPVLDQILLSVHNFNEIWVIDHSTATEQAAGHSGGNSGRGGDLLYRWGNPESYRAGTAADQKLFGQHDASWIASGCPGEGDILIFNNGLNRPAGSYSSVDEIVPPIDENGSYYFEPGTVYGPETTVWCYMADPPSSLYSGLFSGAQRLPDGDTLICDGEAGRFFEVTPEGTTVWEFTNPYPAPIANNVFKIVYIPPGGPSEGPNLDCSGSLSWTDIQAGQIVNGSFQIQNIGTYGSLLNWTINTSLFSWGIWSFTPASGDSLTPEDGSITVVVSVTAPDEENTDFETFIRVENRNNPNDFDVIPVTLKTPLNVLPPDVLRFCFSNNIHFSIHHQP